MKHLSENLNAHIQGEVTSLATCWKIRRQDGIVLGFTTHDKRLEFEGLAYRPTGAFSPTTIASSNAFNVDNLDIQGVLNSAAITEEDLSSGRYDFAEVEIFLINWMVPADGKLVLRSGWMGEVTLKDGVFVAEVRGLMQSFQQTIGEVYSAECRADLGDNRCRVDLSLFSVSGIVTGVVDKTTFSDTGRSEADGWFKYGLLSWISGGNAGLSIEVREQTGQQFSLFDDMPHQIMTGDRYRVHAGCDKRNATCKTRFNNIVNFRGEPFVPGTDSIVKYPGIQ